MTDLSPRVPATVVRADEGEVVSVGGLDHRFLLTGVATAGRLGVEVFALPAATTGARPHIHDAHDETFYVVSGEMTLTTEDGDTVLHPGDVAHAPRGSVHGFANDGTEPLTALCLYTPPGYEQYFRDVHAAEQDGQAVTPALMAQLRARHASRTL